MMAEYVPPKLNVSEAVGQMVQLWQEAAKNAKEFAHAKRTLYLHYLEEGFSETQALELCKTI